MKFAFCVQISVWRTVKFRRIALQRMGRKAFHVDGRWRCEALGAQNIETWIAAVRIFSRWQTVFAARLVRRHKWR